jgi:hypothetical protein
MHDKAMVDVRVGMGQPLDVIFEVGLRAVQAELDYRCQREVA